MTSAVPKNPAKRIICLEFNELSPRLLSMWMQQGLLPNFQRFYRGSQVFKARADADGGDQLEPWVQWYSLHTGLHWSAHGVFHLTDGPKANHDDLWRILQAAGFSVGSFASMNAREIGEPVAFYLPDPWCATEKPHPAELEHFQDVVRTLIQENSRDHSPSLGVARYWKFLTFMLRHGLRFSTVVAIARQLAGELICGGKSRWKRVPLHDRLQLDAFLHYWKSKKPNFSTFFLNSTAHYQHAYWHCAFPEEYSREVSEQDKAQYGSAVLYGYQQMDRVLGDFLKLEEQGAMLMLCTALTQEKSETYDDYFHRYRPYDVDRTLRALGVSHVRSAPVMAEQFMIHFSDESAAQAARALLGGLRVNGKALFHFSKSDPGTLFTGCALNEKIDLQSDILIEGSPGPAMKFGALFYDLGHTKSADHHPDGLLWIKTGAHKLHESPVSILDVAPTLLDMFGLRPGTRPYPAGLSGKSLVPLLA